MTNLLKMDLYRMRKGSSFRLCLILTFVFALLATPLSRLLFYLGSLLSSEVGEFPAVVKLSEFIAEKPSTLTALLALLSVCGFFYADVENGYVKNIAGQMPKRGFTVLSKFVASVPHTLIFVLASIVGDLIGTVIFQRIVVDAGVADSLRVFVLKFLLMESICAILLLFTAAIQNKSLGTVFAVLFGTGLLSLAYLGIDTGLDKIFPKKNFMIMDYMPDQLLKEDNPDTVSALLVSAGVICFFLWLSIRIFDKKDVK